VTFDEAIAANGRSVFRYIQSLTHNAAETDDIYQDTMLKAFLAWEQIRNVEACRSWLFTIARRTFLAERTAPRNRRMTSLEQLAGDGREFAGPEHDVDAQIADQQLLHRVACAIAALPARQREAFGRHYVLGQDYPAVAHAMGCSEGAARSCANNAMLRLKAGAGMRSQVHSTEEDCKAHIRYATRRSRYFAHTRTGQRHAVRPVVRVGKGEH
jgi:RNA polymerase sigma-70 factor (ECF subfamily)